MSTQGAPVDPDQLPTVVAWQCELKAKEEGPALEQLTVGARFLLQCSGPEIPAWDKLPSFHFPADELKFSLHSLKLVTASSTGAVLEVTAYKPGNYSPEWIEMGDGASRVRTAGLKWNVASVVEAQEGKPPEPFPAYGPLFIYWPWWLWSGLGLSIVVIAAMIWWRVRKANARKRLIERLSQKGAALSPYTQFHKDLRQLLRRPPEAADYVVQLDQSFRQYVSRQFLVPAAEWSDTAILKDIQKRHKRLFKLAGQDLKRVLTELSEAKKSKTMNLDDCQQLHGMSRRVADRIESNKESKR